MSNAPRRLGRGLSSLMSPQVVQETQERDEIPVPPKPEPAISPSTPSQNPPRTVGTVPIARVRANPMQPRRDFDERSLAVLAKSIADRGALQPIIVRPAEGGYELIAGERRLRASKLAGLTEIPAIVRPVSDEDMLELALIENIHRENLNPIERARAYRTLQDKYGWSHETIAERMGDDRATVSNYIRLLGLQESVQSMVASGELGIGHAKAILGLTHAKAQTAMAERVVREGWSVRRIEAAIRFAKEPAGNQPITPMAKTRREARPAVRDMEQKLRETLGVQVKIDEGRRPHTGRILIEYYSLDDFERLTERLGVAPDAP